MTTTSVPAPTTSLPSGGRASRAGVAVAVAAKVALATLLGLALAFPEWERFADKAMGARAVVYPLFALLVLAVWLLRRRLLAGPYPWLVDLLLTLPFVVDVGGNALDLYDRIAWFDDACHLGNWVLLTAALGLALRRDLGGWAVLGLCTGLGALAAVLWEIGEYGAFILDTPESATIYRDTLGDLTLGSTGALLAGLAIAAMRRRPPAARASGDDGETR